MAKWRIGLWAVIVVLALTFLWLVRGVLLPFAVAWVIAILLEPVVRLMMRRGLSRPASIGLITISFFLLVGAALVVAIPPISSQVIELQRAITRMTGKIAEESESENHFLRWNPAVRAQPPGPLAVVDRVLESNSSLIEPFGLPTTRRGIVDQYVAPQRDNIAQAITRFFNGFFALIVGAASQLFLFIFVPFFVSWILGLMDDVRPALSAFIPPALRPSILAVIGDVSDVFKKFLRGVLLNVALFTALLAILFSAMGVPYPLLLALMAGILFLIPVIHSFISCTVLALVIGFSGASPYWHPGLGSSWTFAFIVVGAFVVVSTAFDILVTPKTVGKAVGLHPLASMFVVFSGGALFGLPGMIIAYPLAGSLKLTLTRLLALTHQPIPTDVVALPAIPMRHRSAELD